MISLRRAGHRHHEARRDREVWQTFLAEGFGSLELLDEKRLARRARTSCDRPSGSQVITWVVQGALAQGGTALGTGAFQCITGGHGPVLGEANASQTDWAHFIQLSLRPQGGALEPGREQRWFSAAQRRGVLCVVASPNGRSGSLYLQQDVCVYSAVLAPGQHPVHELLPGRRAWLHVVSGELGFGDLVLTTGDAVGFAAERAVSVTARKATELLLVDLGPAH